MRTVVSRSSQFSNESTFSSMASSSLQLVEKDTPPDVHDAAAKSKTNKVYWPRDLLPFEIPDARILTYGYDADVIKRGDHVKTNNFTTHGQDLLVQLQREIPDQVSCYYSVFYTDSRLFLDSNHILRSQPRRYHSERCETHHLGCQFC